MSGHVDKTDTVDDLRRRVNTAERQHRHVVSVSVDVAKVLLEAFDGDPVARAKAEAHGRRVAPWRYE